MKSILDPTFRYTKAVETDLRKTFARIRREQRNAAQTATQIEDEKVKKVLPLARAPKVR